jgi:hypothetical protein
MKKLELFDKSEEIYNKIPKKYVDIILNSIIAQSVYNGNLIKEASYFLNSEDIKNLSNELNIKIEIKENLSEKKYKVEKEELKNISFSKKEQKKEIELSNFEGFD